MSFYRKKKLMEVVKDRGYTTDAAVARVLSPLFEKSVETIISKLNSGNLTMEECEVIGSVFSMTMKEYYDTFMHGLFVENSEGHYVAFVASPYAHLHPKLTKANAPKKKGRTKQDKINEIIAEIDSL